MPHRCTQRADNEACNPSILLDVKSNLANPGISARLCNTQLLHALDYSLVDVRKQCGMDLQQRRWRLWHAFRTKFEERTPPLSDR